MDRAPDSVSGCSYGNGGLIVPSHFVPLAAPGMAWRGIRMMANRRSPFGFESLLNLEVLSWVGKFMRASSAAHVAQAAPLLRDMNLASRGLYEEIISRLGISCGFGKRGLLMLCATKKALNTEAHLATEAGRLGLPAQVLDKTGLRQVDPGVTMNAAGGVYFEDDAHLTPAAFMVALRHYLSGAGVEFVTREVRAFRVAAGRVEAAEEIAGDLFVLAGGAWTSHLCKSLGFRLPLLAGKGYGFTVAEARETLSVPSILTEARVAVTPMQDGARFVGTMELGRPNERLNPHRIAGIRDSIQNYYPALLASEVPVNAVWNGARPCSPDGLPYVGTTGSYQNVIVCAGHAMMGMSLGPISGKLVGELASGDEPSIPLDLLSPNRYA